jgi:hypothetical protein
MNNPYDRPGAIKVNIKENPQPVNPAPPQHTVYRALEPFLLIEIKQVYGKDYYYPANETAETFLRFTGTNTLSKANLRDAAKLGYPTQLKQAEIKGL